MEPIRWPDTEGYTMGEIHGTRQSVSNRAEAGNRSSRSVLLRPLQRTHHPVWRKPEWPWNSSSTEWRPIEYATRALTETETRYAQIKKQMLAIVFSLERFNNTHSVAMWTSKVITSHWRRYCRSHLSEHLDDCSPWWWGYKSTTSTYIMNGAQTCILPIRCHEPTSHSQAKKKMTSNLWIWSTTYQYLTNASTKSEWKLWETSDYEACPKPSL